MYTKVTSCVMNNGFSSQFFMLSKGIRQGCPLSALLFVIVVKVLANHIRQNSNIAGVCLNNKEVKISLLADDTTLFLNDINSLQNALNVMDKFRKCSGLKLNKTKTQILQVGMKDWNLNALSLKCVKEKIYTLGTWFYKEQNQTNTINYDIKYTEFENVLQHWKNQHLLEKIKIVKVFALPKLHYIMTSLAITDQFIKKVQEEIFKFIWNDKQPKIKNSNVINIIENGGLKVPHVET